LRARRHAAPGTRRHAFFKERNREAAMSRVIDVDLGVATRRQKFFCPLDGHEVDCAVVEDSESGRPIEIARCSRFAPADDDVRCEQRCVAMMAHGFTLDSDGDG
jgi:hypothetical protein